LNVGRWTCPRIRISKMDYASAHWQLIAGGGASGGTLVDVLLANVIREGTLRSVPKAE
jgi:hypothetical protein